MYHYPGRRPPRYTSTAPYWSCQCHARREETQKETLRPYIRYLFQGTWALWREIPPLPRMVCIAVGIGVLLVVSSLLNDLMQLVIPLVNAIYMLLGILASAVAIYEFGKRLQSGRRPGRYRPRH